MPFGVGLEGVPFALALGERLPLQKIVERLARFADQRRPEPGLADPVLVPQFEGDRVKPLDQVRQASGDAVIDAQLVDHGDPPDAVGYRVRLACDGSRSSVYWRSSLCRLRRSGP